MDVSALPASMVSGVLVVDPGYGPPLPGPSCLVPLRASSTCSDPCVASPTPAPSWALAPALAAASFALSRSVAAWHFVTQAASSAGVRFIRAALVLSALTGVIATSSTLRLWLRSKQPRQNEKRDNFVRKGEAKHLPRQGDQGPRPQLPQATRWLLRWPLRRAFARPGAPWSLG
jgi:hypothetical protein